MLFEKEQFYRIMALFYYAPTPFVQHILDFFQYENDEMATGRYLPEESPS